MGQRIQVKLHGTSGAGKTTLARNVIENAWENEVIPGIKGKPEAYKCTYIGLEYPIYVLGRYDATCGGFDTVDADHQLVLLQKYAELGHVLYESLFTSGFYGRIGKLSENYGKDHIFAFLDTPLETCIERVKLRRAAAGNPKPFNDANTRDKDHAIKRLKFKLQHEFKRTVVDLTGDTKYDQLMHFYRQAMHET